MPSGGPSGRLRCGFSGRLRACVTAAKPARKHDSMPPRPGTSVPWVSYPPGMATFILTVIGDDRPGLVSALSAPIKAHDGSWERSHLSRLAGKFAGIVQVAVADDRLDALVADLATLDEQGLRVVVERTGESVEHASQRLQLELLGADRPGIVAEVSTALAANGVNIHELRSEVREAPMAGGTLFEARILLDAPLKASIEVLKSVLEGLADELMVEITLSDDL
jgi:glycine cleavage system regulatory protein